MGKTIFKPISAIFATSLKDIAHPMIIFAFSGMVFHLNVRKKFRYRAEDARFFLTSKNIDHF